MEYLSFMFTAVGFIATVYLVALLVEGWLDHQADTKAIKEMLEAQQPDNYSAARAKSIYDNDAAQG